ncbi:MAG: ATP-binding protein [Bdellovibrionia bacterium]
MANRLADVARRFSENKETILQEWERAVLEEIPEARDKGKKAIRNSIPALLEKIARTLSKESPKDTADFESELSMAKEHGQQRARFTDYSMEQVIHEYQLLRKVILRVLEKKKPLNSQDRDVIIDAVALGERIAASEFHNLHLKSMRDLSERTEQRDVAQKQRDDSRIEVRDLISERGMRESFVSGLAHDLRTPITAARMNLELLIRRRNDVGALELHTGRALGELSRLEGMIQDLLDANRIRAGVKLPIKLAGFDLVEEVQHTLDSLAAVHGDRFELEAEERVVGYWDRKGIRRIVENLCINAIKYGDKTTEVTVCIKPNWDERRVELSIHNWGPVIDSESQKTVFEQFRRASLKDIHSIHGWGIGLAVVRGMAESHGGHVEVQSSPEEGTTFKLLLPIDARERLQRAS